MSKKNAKGQSNLVMKLDQTEHKVPPGIESTPLKSWVDDQDNPRVVIDHSFTEQGLNKHITGTKDSEIADSILFAGVNALEAIVEVGKSSTEKVSACLNIIAQSLHDFQPKDVIEARLVTQAAALFQHGMDQLGKAGRFEHIGHSESQVNMAIKLLRVHNETIESLNRYRRGGEQKVIVQHVSAEKAVVNQFNGNQLVGGGDK